MRLSNKTADIRIGVVCMQSGEKGRRGYWLYSERGRERRLLARFSGDKPAKEFLRVLLDWDAAGGNDGGVEK